MKDQNCIFCKIINKNLPGKFIYEQKDLIVIEDIAPRAPIHYLIIPKKHIININYITNEDQPIIWNIFATIQKLATKLNAKDFNLIVNNGTLAGQSVLHLHWHFLSGKNFYTDGFKL